LKPVGQRGAGACGTVDCCHERERQTHNWEAPPGGPHRPFGHGAHPPDLTTERAHPGPLFDRPAFACSARTSGVARFTRQPRLVAAVSGHDQIGTAETAPWERPRISGPPAPSGVGNDRADPRAGSCLPSVRPVAIRSFALGLQVSQTCGLGLHAGVRDRSRDVCDSYAAATRASRSTSKRSTRP